MICKPFGLSIADQNLAAANEESASRPAAAIKISALRHKSEPPTSPTDQVQLLFGFKA